MKLKIEIDLNEVWGDDYSSVGEMLKREMESALKGEMRRIVKAEIAELARTYVREQNANLISQIDAVLGEMDLNELLNAKVGVKR